MIRNSKWPECHEHPASAQSLLVSPEALLERRRAMLLQRFEAWARRTTHPSRTVVWAPESVATLAAALLLEPPSGATQAGASQTRPSFLASGIADLAETSRRTREALSATLIGTAYLTVVYGMWSRLFSVSKPGLAYAALIFVSLVGAQSLSGAIVGAIVGAIGVPGLMLLFPKKLADQASLLSHFRFGARAAGLTVFIVVIALLFAKFVRPPDERQRRRTHAKALRARFKKGPGFRDAVHETIRSIRPGASIADVSKDVAVSTIAAAMREDGVFLVGDDAVIIAEEALQRIPYPPHEWTTCEVGGPPVGTFAVYHCNHCQTEVLEEDELWGSGMSAACPPFGPGGPCRRRDNRPPGVACRGRAERSGQARPWRLPLGGGHLTSPQGTASCSAAP
ncbi:MAG: hypothetical protein RL385_1249 [Pseudomonadota bacterium]